VDSLPPQGNVRLVELVASLCLATDLATGHPLEHGLRRTLLAVWLGEELGLTEQELSDAYYGALLGGIGCTLEGATLSGFFEDEIAFGEQIVLVDPTRPLEVAAFFLRKVGEGEPPLRRAGKLLAFARLGLSEHAVICRDAALQVGKLLNIGPAVPEALGQLHEFWNGKGEPRQLKGEEISLATRLAQVAHDAEIFNRIGGVDAAVSVIRERSGKVYDPRNAACFCEVATQLLSRLQLETAWDAVLEAEPAPLRLLSPREFDEVAQTIANFVDMRSVYTVRHSPRVASLAEAASRELGLSETDATTLRRAGLLHDLGRTGTPVAVWDKQGPLTGTEWERMKKHSSLTELILARSSSLGNLGTLAGLHHERLDGSGHRGVGASFLPMASRILAVADVYETKLEPRPHRPAITPEAAAEEVQRQARGGQLDGDAVKAVLAAAGHQLEPKRHERPAGLSEREVEVLCLAVTGLSNRQMGEALFVSPKTVGHHIQHIYDKIGVSTRVGATLFALHHGLAEQAA